MPARQKRYDDAMQLAPWVNKIDDRCLRDVVLEALIARNAAVRANGDDKTIAAGDATLEQIEYGRVSGRRACRKAATAVRKFDEAYMGAERRSGKGHALRKRYGRAKAKKKTA
jgi:hypothetical protein